MYGDFSKVLGVTFPWAQMAAAAGAVCGRDGGGDDDGARRTRRGAGRRACTARARSCQTADSSSGGGTSSGEAGEEQLGTAAPSERACTGGKVRTADATELQVGGRQHTTNL